MLKEPGATAKIRAPSPFFAENTVNKRLRQGI